VENIEKEERFTRILDALDRTPPPVLVFATKNGDVDDVHEYLLLKGLEVRGIHAGKSQQDRNQAVDDFKAGAADILVASDVAAKGLDFPNIEQVINFDMPNEIEQYVHRIGRTGRGGNKGVATTFVDVNQVKPTLMKDLFGILKDAKQRAPLFLVGGDLDKYDEPDEVIESDEVLTCTVCGGFGHRVTTCPKLALIGKKNLTRDVVTGGDY
jgi:ATP-dependent RNA helicase DDX41